MATSSSLDVQLLLLRDSSCAVVIGRWRFFSLQRTWSRGLDTEQKRAAIVAMEGLCRPKVGRGLFPELLRIQ